MHPDSVMDDSKKRVRFRKFLMKQELLSVKDPSDSNSSGSNGIILKFGRQGRKPGIRNYKRPLIQKSQADQSSSSNSSPIEESSTSSQSESKDSSIGSNSMEAQPVLPNWMSNINQSESKASSIGSKSMEAQPVLPNWMSNISQTDNSTLSIQNHYPIGKALSMPKSCHSLRIKYKKY